jgi:hypothetical protein
MNEAAKTYQLQLRDADSRDVFRVFWNNMAEAPVGGAKPSFPRSTYVAPETDPA